MATNWKKRREGATEFGGDAGRIQRGGSAPGVAGRTSSGAAVPEHDALTPAEQAAVLRGYGMRTASGENTASVGGNGGVWPEGEARRVEAQERLSGRTLEDVL